jgi:hypothetical protein
MSFRTFRHTLAGTVLTAALCLIGPSPAQAADPQEPVSAGSFWEAAWQWVEGWTATLSAAPSIESAPGLDADAGAGYRDSQDAGWTIDPDG